MNLMRENCPIVLAVTMSVCFGLESRAIETAQDSQAALLHYRKAEDICRSQGGRSRLQRALNEVNMAIKLDPTNGNCHSLKANILHSVDDDEAALPEVDLSLKLSPQDAKSWDRRAAILLRLKRNNEALASSSKAIMLRPKEADYYRTRAKVLLYLLRFPEAERDCDKCVAIKPEDLGAHAERLKIRMRLKNWRGTVEDASFCLAHTPRTNYYAIFGTLRTRAAAYTALKQYANAARDYEQALKINAHDRRVLLSLQKVYAAMGDKRASLDEKKRINSFDQDIVPPESMGESAIGHDPH